MLFRRDFLKLSGLFSAVMIATVVPAAEVAARSVETELHGRFYRGTADGKIYVSEDAGRNWTLHSKFGSHLSVHRLYVDFRQRLVAVLDCEGYDFRVALGAESRAWRTI